MNLEKYKIKSPILLILFNRPDQTEELLKSIKLVKPKNLYIGIDGPRNNDDQEKINKILNLINQYIDFDCNLKINNLNENLWCGLGPRAAISWFFENVESGIILEDDCIPSESFFNFCDELLEKYKKDQRIWMISGDNGGPILKSNYFDDFDYTFSNVPLIWGWATWKDRWEKYDDNLNSWEKGTIFNLKYLTHVSIFEKFIVGRICKNSSKSKEKNFWDFQMYSSMMKHNSFAVVPRLNLISNIGWGDIATHTKDENFRSYSPVESYIELNHNPNIEVNKKINSMITYSIHTNTQKNIIDKDKINLIRLFYLLNRIQYYFSYILNFLVKK